MFNSATFVSDMLVDSGFESKVVTVVDNNSIDREVHDYKPTHVFIEGYWVVPEKFDVLKKLHPTVNWIIRCHSELPFLSQEGVAIGWTFGYLNRGVYVASNSPRMKHEFLTITDSIPNAKALLPLLPNYYPTKDFTTRDVCVTGEYVDIACFGALRPMKNQLMQAAAAIEFAETHGKKLRFHVNSGRVEMHGQNTLKNLNALFENLPDHEIISHGWAGHEDFIELVKLMDFSMQVSFTETFNIVTADALSVGTPVITSSEVPFVYPVYASPTSSKNMVKQMGKVWKNRVQLNKESKRKLDHYDALSKMVWNSFVANEPFTDEQQACIEKKLLAPAAWKYPFYELWIDVKTWFSKL
jgi:glycosyltransferase involved in cell wall biosynthesis